MERFCLTPYGRDLAAAYYPRVPATAARPFIRKRPDRADDIMSAAHLGLVIAVATWNKNRTDRGFFGYGVIKATNEILNMFRGERAGIRSGVTRRYGPDQEEETGCPDPEPGWCRDESFERLLTLSPERYREFLRLVYRDGLGVLEAGELVGYRTKSWSSLNLKVARDEIRAGLERSDRAVAV